MECNAVDVPVLNNFNISICFRFTSTKKDTNWLKYISICTVITYICYRDGTLIIST